jgi:hypothetical protein
MDKSLNFIKLLSTKNDRIPPFVSFIGEGLSDDERIIVLDLRIICSGISLFSCLFIIILYIVMFLRARCNICTRRELFNTVSSKDSKDTGNSEEVSQHNENSTGESNEILLEAFKRNRTLYKNKVHYLSNNNSEAIVKGNQSERSRLKMGLGSDLVFFLIFSNLCFCIASFLNFSFDDFLYPEKESPVCISQGYIQNLFDMSAVAWTTCISRVTMFVTKKSVNEIKLMEKRFWLLVVYCFFPAVVFSSLPLMTHSYGPSGPWCWIDLQEKNSSSYIWITIINVYSYIHIIYISYATFISVKYFYNRKREIIEKRGKQEKEARFLKKYIFILIFYPVIALLTRLPSTINRLASLIFEKDFFVLYLLHCIFFPLTGFFNSIVNSYFYRKVFICQRKRRKELNEEEGKETALNI